jgi:hypothetical protein
MKFFKGIFLSVWECLQNFVGFVAFWLYKGEILENKDVYGVNDDFVTIKICDNLKGGVSLGEYILIGKNKFRNNAWSVTRHEFGHTKQSRILGPLYLFVIGIPSILHASIGLTDEVYYKFYTEKWADKLGGVTR